MTDETEVAEDAAEYEAIQNEGEAANPETEEAQAEGETQAEGEETAKDTDDDQDGEKKQHRSAEKRIKQLTRRYREEQRANQEMAKRLEAIEAKMAESNKPARPDPDNYGTTEEYEDALIDWKLEQRESKGRQETKPETPALGQSWQTQVKAARDSHEDFDDVAMNLDLPVTTSMVSIITDSDRGADILYHLGKNPDQAAEIAAMSPVQQARVIGRIEAKLEDQADRKPTKPTQAPNPPNPIKGKAEATVNPERMSADDWRKHREKELEKRYGG